MLLIEATAKRAVWSCVPSGSKQDELSSYRQRCDLVSFEHCSLTVNVVSIYEIKQANCQQQQNIFGLFRRVILEPNNRHRKVADKLSRQGNCN